jgi:hypothetical protein
MAKKSVRAEKGLMGQISEPPQRFCNVKVIANGDGTHDVDLRVYDVVDGQGAATEFGFRLRSRSIPALIHLLQNAFHQINMGESRKVSA